MGAFDTRGEMTEAFEALMTDRHEVVRTYQRYQFGKNPLKSYLLEADYPSSRELEGQVADAFLTRKTEVTTTDDHGLFRAVVDDDMLFMVDCFDSRFWVVHTTESAKDADDVVGAVAQNSHVDSLWLPTDFLKQVLTLGQPYGFATSFDTDYFTKRPRGEIRAIEQDEDDEFEPEVGIQSLKIQMSGTDAGVALGALEDAPELFPHLALSRAKVRHGAEQKSTDDVRFDGRTVARGESFWQHMRLLRRIHGSYSAWLNATETEYRLEAGQTDGVSHLAGRPLVIYYPDAIPEPARFYRRLLSGVRPFRLWGIPRDVGGGYMKASATDLHNGATLALDMAPEFLRIYLYEDTCANTVLRLFTNLQQAFSRNLRLSDGERDVQLTLTSDTEATT